MTCSEWLRQDYWLKMMDVETVGIVHMKEVYRGVEHKTSAKIIASMVAGLFYKVSVTRQISGC